MDFPDPLVPIIPHASPFLIFRLTSFRAKNSLNISSRLTSFTKYSFRLSIRSEAILNRTVARSTITAYSLSKSLLFIISSNLNIQYKMILLFHENQGTDQQHNQGNYKTIKNQTHIWKHPIQYNHSKLGNVCI